MGHASLEPGGSDSLGLNESSCGVVWIWLDQRVSLRVRELPSSGSTEKGKLCLDLSLFLTGSCSRASDFPFQKKQFSVSKKGKFRFDSVSLLATLNSMKSQ